MDNRFKNLRILVLLLILLFVSLQTWLTKARSTDWDETLWVVVYPINGDDSQTTSRYIANLREDDFNSIESFLSRQADRYNVGIADPVLFKLAPEISQRPPQPPEDGNIIKTVFWSLNMRYWALKNDSFDGPRPDIQMFVVYYDPETHPELRHSVGLQKGMLGIVNAFAHRRMTETNNVIITHELLHTVGASDKYAADTAMPLYPLGYAEPDKRPLYPQRLAEIMGGRIPLSEQKAAIPDNLSQVVIGPGTAIEIRWFDP